MKIYNFSQVAWSPFLRDASTFIENTNTIIVINYNYGTQFWTPLGEKVQELKEAIYTTVISP